MSIRVTIMKKILKKKKLIKSSHDRGFGIYGQWRFSQHSRHTCPTCFGRAITRQPIPVGPGSSAKSEESRNKSHAFLSINIINNTLNNYVVSIHNVYINRYLNVEHTTNKIVRIRVKMYWVLYY